MLNRSLLLSTALIALFSFSNIAVAEDQKADAPAAAPEKALTQEQMNEETYKQLSLFGGVFETVREKYVDKISDEKLIEYAIKGMLTNLDPHSDYMTAKDFDDMKIQTKGEFGGLGIEVTMQDGLVKVVSPIDDTPAFKAGIQAGDFITHLDKKKRKKKKKKKKKKKTKKTTTTPPRAEGVGVSAFFKKKKKRETIKIKS